VDLEAATEQVYAATPEDFMAVRTALVAEARQAKDRELAKAIGALRKPTRSAWLINLLARSATDEVASLLDLGEALREAQASLSGPELRRLSSERQKAVRALARSAESLAAEHSQRVTDAQLQEVSQHLQAALSDPALAEDVRAGRVTQIVTFGGFGPWEAAPPGNSPPTCTGAGGGGRAVAAGATSEERATPDAAESGGSETLETPSGPSDAELQAARDAWEQTQAEVRDVEAELDEARQAEESAAAEAERLRTELAAAEETAGEANVRRAAVEERLAQARERADEASRALEELLD
jgi:chromosome segregation ATPase